MNESAWPSGKVPRIYADLSRDFEDRLRPDRCSFVDVVCAAAAAAVVKSHRRPRARCEGLRACFIFIFRFRLLVDGSRKNVRCFLATTESGL